MAEAVLEIRDLSITFGGLKAVDSLSFSIEKGEIFGLIGPNGAGKTTVFNCITQFYKPQRGSVLFSPRGGKPQNLVGKRVHDIIGLGLARTFQNVELIREISVLDNLLIGAHTHYKSGALSQIFRTKKSKIEEKALYQKACGILETLGLLHLKDEYAGALPYGMLKNIELGRTLMSDPSLIILDEPAAGLNDDETLQLAQTIKDLRKGYGLTILLVEHDMRLVMGICDKICAISFGKFLACGTPLEIKQSALVQEAYLGEGEEE